MTLIAACDQKPVNNPAVDTTLIKRTEAILPQKDINILSPVDISPMDMSYYPPNYPQLKMSAAIKSNPVLRVIYSRPHLQGRKLFKDFLAYGEPWRLGANEATELDVFQPVVIDGQKLPQGRYTLYCIPKEQKWMIVINSNLDTWGLKMESSKDILKAEIPVSHNNPNLEYFTMVFEKASDGAVLIMGWGDLMARLPIKFKQ